MLSPSLPGWGSAPRCAIKGSLCLSEAAFVGGSAGFGARADRFPRWKRSGRTDRRTDSRGAAGLLCALLRGSARLVSRVDALGAATSALDGAAVLPPGEGGAAPRVALGIFLCPSPGWSSLGGSPLSPLFGSPGSRSRCAARRAERCCGAAPWRGCWRHRGAAAGIVGCGSAAAPPGPALCPRRPSARPAVNPAALRCRLGVDERRRRREEEEEEGGSVTAAGKRDVPRFEAGVQ